MTQTPFDILKQTCNDACHERHACVAGYKQMIKSENVSQMMATWRNNWEDVVQGKFADIIHEKLPEQYPFIREEMHKAGIYMNKCPDDANSNTLVIITDSDTPIHIYGEAKAYVLGQAEVVVHDHAQIYNQRFNANITLLDYAYGNIQSGMVTAQGRSTLNCACCATIDGAVKVTAYGGTVKAIKYRSIEAYRDTVVYSKTDYNIKVSGTSKIISNE